MAQANSKKALYQDVNQPWGTEKNGFHQQGLGFVFRPHLPSL